MTGRLEDRPERRRDPAMADIVEVGLLFATVFGWNKAEIFFRRTVVEPHVYRRVLLGYSRVRQRHDDNHSHGPCD